MRTPEKIIALLKKHEKEDLTITDISYILGMTYQAIHKNIKLMEAEGMIKTFTPPLNKRIKIVKLS